MATGMWTAVSGAKARTDQLDVVANNLANMDTVGFKKDSPTFKEYLAMHEREPSNFDIKLGPVKDKDFYPLDGRDQSFVITDATYTNFKQGNLKVTHAPFDVALEGPGFLEVSTPQGVRYTRQGSLKVATDGRLVTPEGYPVLAAQPGGLAATAQLAQTVQPGQGGLLTQGGVAAGSEFRSINLKDRTPQISISENGEIYAGEDLVAKLNVVEFKDSKKLRKQGGLLFENNDPTNVLTQVPQTLVRQGMLETANVNPIEEMTNLIKANRLFEHDMKTLKTYNELLGKEANDIGKL
ncbi:MAG: flagellar basal-body rod protein FlgF [Deltaproteobacteria bacterium]|nr:flagellar basal-body rod protein FlgF [Deltaproteobacteria bacterium]